MSISGIGNAKNIDEFVEKKIKNLESKDRSLKTLFEFMFSEKDNVLYERSKGYRIEKTTYKEAYEKILLIAGSLESRLENYEKDSIVGLYMENSLEWIETFWAILAAGFRPLLMNLRMPSEMLTAVINDVGVKAVINSGNEKPFNNCDNISVSDIVENLHKDSLTHEKDIETSRDYKFAEEILFMSSGTSANVKVCAYSAEELFFQITDSFNIIKKCSLMKKHYNGSLKQLTFLPFYHVFGFIAVYLWFGFFSRTFVHLENMAPETLLNTIRRHEVTHIFAVPLFWETVYEQAIRTIKERGEKTYSKFLKGMKISKSLSSCKILSNLFSKFAFKEIRQNLFGNSISFMITGGSEIKSEAIEFFNAIGYRLADGYGMTEIGITSVELSSNKSFLNGCSIGKPFSSIEYEINEAGELLVRGRSTAKYILENGKKVEKEEWFNTHDLANEHSGGFKVLGRKDDLVVSNNGENLNPNLIEPLFSVPTCLIKHENKPILLVSLKGYVTKERYDSVSDKITGKLKETGLVAAIGKPVFIKDAFVKGDEFKKNRGRIAKDYADGRLNIIELSKIESTENENEITKTIRNIFAVALKKDLEEIGSQDDFFTDLGGSSLDYFGMVTEMNSEFNLSIPVGQSMELSTVESLSKYIEEELGHVD